MKIETKLSFDQTAYFMHANKVVSLPVESIKTEQTKGAQLSGFPISVTYGFRIYERETFKDWLYMNERDVFSSKEALLASL